MNKFLHTILAATSMVVLPVACTPPPDSLATPLAPGQPIAVAKQTPNIFSQYSATGNSKLAESWTRRIDTSGVSFDHKKTVTLITPRHVVMAKHYQRPLTSKVIFHDRRGRHLERKLVRVQRAAHDVAVALLDSPVPAGYRPYALPRPKATHSASLPGKPVYLTDQNRRIFVHQIAGIQRGTVFFRHPPSQRAGYMKKLVSGDSGNPSFILHQGEPILIETHTTGGPGAGPYYGDPVIQQSIREIVKAMDPAYQIRTVDIY